jgi:hypothetical protein
MQFYGKHGPACPLLEKNAGVFLAYSGYCAACIRSAKYSARKTMVRKQNGETEKIIHRGIKE